MERIPTGGKGIFMPAYRVHAPVGGTASIVVEADDEEAAKRLAAQAPLEDWSYDKEWAPVQDPGRMIVQEEGELVRPVDWAITPSSDSGK
jgi:hypothetical protein